MFSLILSVGALILSFGMLLAGNSLLFVIIGLRAAHEGFSVGWMGLITGAYFAGFAAGSVICARLIARIGHIRTFAALASAISGLILGLSLLPTPLAWMALRFLTGICFAGLYMVVESWLNARASNEYRGRLLAFYGVVAFLGYAIGPMFANLGSASDFPLFIIASIIVSFALIPVTITNTSAPVQEPAGPASGGYSILRLFRETPLGMLGTMAVGLTQGSFLGLAPTFGTSVGMTASQIATFMTVTMLSGLVCQFPLGWLSDRFDRRLVIALIMLAGGGATGSFAIWIMTAPIGINPLLISAALAGATIFPIYAIIAAHTNDALPHSSLVQAAAALTVSYSIGSTLGGVLASTAMQALGPGGFYGFIAICAILLGLFAIYRMTQREVESEGGYPVAPVSPGTQPIELALEDTQLVIQFDQPQPR